MQPRRIDADARPARLRSLATPPAELWVAGELDDDAKVIAIVGSREASEPALEFATKLATAIGKAGAVVLSGGALGVDAAAHRGALAAGARTWCVAGTGHEHTFPPQHSELFDEIVAKGGAMIWPFTPGSPKHRGCFVRRNGVLVALANVIVIVQASIPSGTLNAAHWCEKLGRPVYVVCASPWTKGFEGSHLLLERGARPVASVDGLLVALGLTTPAPKDKRVVYGLPRPVLPPSDPSARTVLDAVGDAPIHVDEIVVRSGLATSAVSTALLTLALENVLVEGPSGFFRRANAAQALKIPIDIVESSQRHLDE